MIDELFKTWLIEVNTNPDITTSSPELLEATTYKEDHLLTSQVYKEIDELIDVANRDYIRESLEDALPKNIISIILKIEEIRLLEK